MRPLRVLAAVLCLAVIAPAAAFAHRSDADVYRIPFSSGTVDPARDFPAASPRDHDLVLVQFRAVGLAGAVQAVAATGATLVQPLAPVSYLVWADAAETTAIRALRDVRWAGVLPAAARVSDSVTTSTTRLRVTLIGADALAGLPDASARPRTFTAADGVVVEIPGGLAAAQTLARLPRVYSVAAATDQPQLREELSNAVVAQGTRSGPLTPNYRQFLTRYGADGTGVIIGHVDGGVDFNHPELADRIHACIGYGTDGPTGCAAGNHDDAIGHGTHTLGTVLGNGTTGLGDLNGFDYGLGVAPGAKAVVQNAIHTPNPNAFRNGYRPVYRQAQELGAIVSQNSWGPSGKPKGYDAATREFDTIVRDVNDSAVGDQALALVFSIMNGGGGTSTQGSPDEAKNIIGVGGSGNRGLGAPGHDDLCTCTAHGPALDGRLLPDLVAPGQQVVSTRATQGTLCGMPGVGWSPVTPALETPPSPLHAGCTGTSMASPHVSGAYAVFVDWYRDHFDGATPSPALVKAALINGADDLAGGKDADGKVLSHIPNNQQGWGRLNLGNVLRDWDAGVVHVDQSIVFDQAGESMEGVHVRALDPTKPLKATLVWTDAPGPGLGGKTPGWVNDLNLQGAASDGGAWWGNAFTDGFSVPAESFSVPAGKPDAKNNVENIFVKEPGEATYTFDVVAHNLLGDGLPNREGLTDQDFALVITNAELVELP